MWFRGWLIAFALAGACASDPGASATVYAGGGTSIAVLRADLTRGTLGVQQTLAAGDQGYLLEVDRANRRAYLQTQIGIPVVIRTFDIQPGGTLAPAADVTLPHPLVEGVTQIQRHPTAPWLLVSTTGGAS